MSARTQGDDNYNTLLVGMPIGTATLESNLAAFNKTDNSFIIKPSDASSRYMLEKSYSLCLRTHVQECSFLCSLK